MLILCLSLGNLMLLTISLFWHREYVKRSIDYTSLIYHMQRMNQKIGQYERELPALISTINHMRSVVVQYQALLAANSNILPFKRPTGAQTPPPLPQDNA